MALQLQDSFNTLALRFNELPATRKMLLAGALAASIALVVGLWLWSSTPDYKVLFSNLEDRDAGTVTATLQQMNVPYKTEANGTLLVPSNQVYDLRFKLASQGIPKGGAVGFELLDQPKLGLTQFQEQIAYQRALEGELARTVQSLAPVESARVHLAIPKPSVFIRDKQNPSASVLVKLYPGRSLDPGQVQSIVHLVSSSVPELSPNNVTVVNQAGDLLTAKNDAQSLRNLNASQLEFVKAVEADYVQRIEAILVPIVGAGNVKAEVRADLDFSEDEATSETYKPNPKPDDQSIRSLQSVDDLNTSPQAQGVPGALTNQPPGPATAPVTAPAGANAGPNVGPNGSGQGNSSHKENTVNYELDKTIRHVKASEGRVKRISVAVVVNNKAARDKTAKATPLSAQEMAQINGLVKEAMGYTQERGDSVNVVNAVFSEGREEAEVPLWKDPENIAMAKEVLKNLIIFGLAFYLVFGVLRPMLRDLMKPVEHPPAEGGAEAGEGGHGEGGVTYGPDGKPVPPAGDTYADILAKVREYAKANPKITADIAKEWMNKE